MPVDMTIKPRSSGYIAGVLRPMVERHFDPRMRQAFENARATAPVDKQGGGGRLRDAHRLYARGGSGRFVSQTRPGKELVCQYEIAVEVPYAAFVIRGTRPHLIRSTGPWPLRNAKTGAVFGPVVNHPGNAPNNYLERAMQQAGMA